MDQFPLAGLVVRCDETVRIPEGNMIQHKESLLFFVPEQKPLENFSLTFLLSICI
jgi:hypothetical protein